MTSKHLISLDLSTTCTGFAVFNIEDKTLLRSGVITSKIKSVYPGGTLSKLQDLSLQVIEILKEYDPHLEIIAIEEINRHKSRKSGKVLDGYHWILLQGFPQDWIERVRFVDSDGACGWRTFFNLKLSEEDKLMNKEHKKANKKPKTKIKRGELKTKKLPIITKKHLAERLINKTFKTSFDVTKHPKHSDEVDAIGVGFFWLQSHNKL